jgi:hypothetical protein
LGLVKSEVSQIQGRRMYELLENNFVCEDKKYQIISLLVAGTRGKRKSMSENDNGYNFLQSQSLLS